MIIIKGLGWIRENRYGCIKKKKSTERDFRKSWHGLLRQKKIFTYPVKNFGRFDAASKITCALTGLALFDAGLTYREGEKKKKIGIIGTNKIGSWESNLKYLRDYIDAGRKLARGNLFIYTIPSSPLAEASIHFGLQGPLFYLLRPADQIGALLKCAEGLLLRKEAEIILAVKVDGNEGFCIVLSQETKLQSTGLCTFNEFLDQSKKVTCIKDLLGIFTHEN